MSQHCRANPCCGDRPCSGTPLPQHASGLPSRNKQPSPHLPTPEASPAPVEQVRSLIERIAATPIWQDTYPDGPDLAGGVYTITPDDVRACRAAAATPPPASPALDEVRRAAIEECAQVADAERESSGEDYPGEVWIANRIAAAIRALAGGAE